MQRAVLFIPNRYMPKRLRREERARLRRLVMINFGFLAREVKVIFIPDQTRRCLKRLDRWFPEGSGVSLSLRYPKNASEYETEPFVVILKTHQHLFMDIGFWLGKAHSRAIGRMMLAPLRSRHPLLAEIIFSIPLVLLTSMSEFYRRFLYHKLFAAKKENITKVRPYEENRIEALLLVALTAHQYYTGEPVKADFWGRGYRLLEHPRTRAKF